MLSSFNSQNYVLKDVFQHYSEQKLDKLLLEREGIQHSLFSVVPEKDTPQKNEKVIGSIPLLYIHSKLNYLDDYYLEPLLYSDFSNFGGNLIRRDYNVFNSYLPFLYFIDFHFSRRNYYLNYYNNLYKNNLTKFMNYTIPGKLYDSMFNIGIPVDRDHKNGDGRATFHILNGNFSHWVGNILGIPKGWGLNVHIRNRKLCEGLIFDRSGLDCYPNFKFLWVALRLLKDKGIRGLELCRYLSTFDRVKKVYCWNNRRNFTFSDGDLTS